MSESLLYDETMFSKNVNFEVYLRTLDNSDIGYFIEVESIDPDYSKEKS